MPDFAAIRHTEFAALDDQYQAAVKSNNAATMERILLDDFILVVGKRQADAVLAALKRQRERAYVIGEVTRASRGTANRVVFG